MMESGKSLRICQAERIPPPDSANPMSRSFTEGVGSSCSGIGGGVSPTARRRAVIAATSSL